MKNLFFALLLALTLPVLAVTDVAGVRFAETTKVGAGETALNGAGMRGVRFLKGYAIAMYLPHRASTAEEALAMKGPKRLNIVPLINTPGEAFATALPNGIRKNHSEQHVATLDARIQALKATLMGINTIAKGANVNLDWLPDAHGGITRLTINGEAQGDDIAGEDFYRALLNIWLGEHPVQRDLKENLLGKTT
jgi:hypothetical protein